MTPRIKKLYTFPIEEDLAVALKRLKQRDGIPEAEQIRRALRRWLTKKGVLRSGTGSESPTRADRLRRRKGAN